MTVVTVPKLDQVDQVDIEATKLDLARIQRAGIAVTSNGLRMVIAKSLGDKNEAEGVGQGEADEGDSEGEGVAQRAKIYYLLAGGGPPTTTPAQ